MFIGLRRRQVRQQIDSAGAREWYMYLSCNLSEGSVVIDDESVMCNGSSTFSLDSPLEITGNTTTNFVSVANASTVLVLRDLSITHSSPFVVDQSSVQITLNGWSTITAQSGNHAGLECTGSSNISLTSMLGGRL
jgi:hypothetical protein